MRRVLGRCGGRMLLGRHGAVSTASVRHCASDAAAYTCEPGPSSPDMRRYGGRRVRNFAIVAHVDHGKSTLADRLMQLTGALPHDAPGQFLDRLQVERRRGITVKSQVATMFYTDGRSGADYLLNLIDTPGHSDFSYEVHRALAACQGVLLLVDANKGVESQTVAYFWKCLEMAGLVIVPVINKIDIAAGDKMDALMAQLEEQFGFKPDDCIKVSAKTGENVPSVLEAIVDHVPGPSGCRSEPVQGQVLDAWHLHYHGAALLVSLASGTLHTGSKVHFSRARRHAVVSHVGIMGEGATPTGALYAGQVGYCVCAPQQHRMDAGAFAALVGDTLRQPGVDDDRPVANSRHAIRPEPTLYAQLFPTSPQYYDQLNSAVERVHLNDTSVRVSAASSAAFGRGWRLGFLGLLHMAVFADRLAAEHHADAFVMTRAAVPYKVVLRPHAAKRHGGRSEIVVEQPHELPVRTDVQCYLEPLCEVHIRCAPEHTGAVIALCTRRRMGHVRTDTGGTASDDCLCHVFTTPLAEIIDDFGDELKSVTAGYATFEIGSHAYRYELVDLVKLSALINHERVPAFDVLLPRSIARTRGLHMIEKIATRIPMHQFAVPIQAAIGSKIIARVNVAPYRQDFASKLKDNFSDRTRVAKLLKSQKAGKARQKAKTSVSVPHAAYVDVFQR